ncbi:MAG: RHS repeat-associated core domain-containing protein, partial [Verrucomicrobiota bacterium]
RGKVVEHRQYDSFGKVLARTANVGVAFGYTGRPIDEKTGLSDDRARFYDPGVGRFINEDPSGFKGGDTNLFRYVGNDPLDRVDPSGLTAKWAGYGGKGSVPAAGWGAYGAGTLLTSGAGNSTPTPFVMARAKSSPSYESPVWSGTKAFFGSISDSIVGGVTGLVTGEAGRQLGERAFQITVNNNGGKFNGQWGQVAYNIAGQMAGTHSMAEGMVGIDLASHAAVAAEDRVGRFAGGLGQFAGIAAGGAGMTRSAFGASSFTNLPGSAAVSRVSSSLNSAAARVWSRVDDSAWVGNNAAVGPGPVMRTLVERLEANAARRLAEIQANSGPSSHFFTRHGAQTSIEQQFDRATTGLTPDGFKGNLVDSSRFLSHRAQLNAVQAAEGIFYRTGKKVFTFDAGYEIGEGFTRNATDLMRTTNVTAVFNASGNIKTLFPSLSPHP